MAAEPLAGDISLISNINASRPHQASELRFDRYLANLTFAGRTLRIFVSELSWDCSLGRPLNSPNYHSHSKRLSLSNPRKEGYLLHTHTVNMILQGAGGHATGRSDRSVERLRNEDQGSQSVSQSVPSCDNEPMKRPLLDGDYLRSPW